MKKGISLVALIITIIVLIILTAAVVMTGINTPQNAQLAVFKNNVSAVQEAVTLKMLNNLTEAAANEQNAETYKWVGVADGYTYDALTGPTFNVLINEISAVKLSETIKENINISDADFDKYYVDNNGVIYYYDITTQTGFEYEGITYYNATKTNKTTYISEVKTLGELVNADMYGTRVWGYTAGGVSDWKVFYKQTVDGQEYVYLIASDLLKEEQIPSITGTTISSASSYVEYGALRFGSIPEVEPMNSNNLFMANWGDYSTNANGKCVSILLNTNNWSAFATPTNTNLSSYVKGAIGSPTAEMFAASWTENGGTSLLMTDTKEGIVSPYGYYLKYNGTFFNVMSYYTPNIAAVYATDEYMVNLYYNDYAIPRPGNPNMSLYYFANDVEDFGNYSYINYSYLNFVRLYWLASPFAASDRICAVHTDRGVDSVWGFCAGLLTTKGDMGVRPVVCIQSNIPASLYNGEIMLSNKEVESIAVTTPPTKTVYKEGSELSIDGMVVTARYKDGTSEVIDKYKVQTNTRLEKNDTEVTITYAGKSTTQAITVFDHRLNTVGTTLGEIISSGDAYGASVSGYTAGGVSDWKVFYKQTVDGEEYVYLITSDALGEEQIPSITGATISTYEDEDFGIIYWESIPAVQTIDVTSNNLFMANWGDYSTNENGKCISALLNTSNWNLFASPANNNIADYVEGAIGSPTAEMFAASWTEGGGTSLSVTNIYEGEESTEGYYYNYGGEINRYFAADYNSLNNYYDSQEPGTPDFDLYYLNYQYNNDTLSYWLASPSWHGNDYLCCVYKGGNDYSFGGDCEYAEMFDDYYGLRPVICIQAGILASVSEGVITLNP